MLIYRNAFLSIWEAYLHKIYSWKVGYSPLVLSHFHPDSAVTGCHAASSVQGGFSTGADWWGGLDWAGWADPGKWPPDQFQDPQNQAYEANLWKLLSWASALTKLLYFTPIILLFFSAQNLIFYPFCFLLYPFCFLLYPFCFSSRVMMLNLIQWQFSEFNI